LYTYLTRNTDFKGRLKNTIASNKPPDAEICRIIRVYAEAIFLFCGDLYL